MSVLCSRLVSAAPRSNILFLLQLKIHNARFLCKNSITPTHLNILIYNLQQRRVSYTQTQHFHPVNLNQILKSGMFSSSPTGTINQNLLQRQNSKLTRAVNNSDVQRKQHSLTSFASLC